MTSHKNNQKISVQASECLAIYPIVRQFVYNVALPNGLQAPACQALLAMASLIDQVMMETLLASSAKALYCQP